MAIHHSIEEILRIMADDLNLYSDLKPKNVNKKNEEHEFNSSKDSIKKLSNLESWHKTEYYAKRKEVENIKEHNSKMIANEIKNMMSKKNYSAYGHSSLRSHKYGLARDSTIFNNQIFRLLMDNLIEDKNIYNIILKDSPLFPHEDIKKDNFLNQNGEVYLVVTNQKTDKILGVFNFTAYRMWIEHVGNESSYKKYTNTYMKIIKKSKTHYKIIVSKTRPLLDVRDDKVIHYSKENKL